MLGALTMGNATLVAYDGKPVLATDPWLGDEDPAYFGSWGLSHEIPAFCREDIFNAKYIWFSHGHPDHLNVGSLRKLVGKKILLGDHVGGKLAHDLREMGFEVDVLPDRKWVRLSPRIKVFCITTCIQDSILLVDVNGRLFVDINDAADRDCTLLLRRIIAGYENSYLLALAGCHDTDMLNFHTEDGNFIHPVGVNLRSVGEVLSVFAKRLGTTHVIPFSTFHAYRRTDSAWANEFGRKHADFLIEADYRGVEYVPPFSRIDCENPGEGGGTPLDPEALDDSLHEPEEFGDNWSDELDRGDVGKIEAYFRRRELVRDNFDFINFRVGGKDNNIKLGGKDGRGLTFEVPRCSLMTAVENEVFDDLLIGNFMKTTMHNTSSLYGAGRFTFATAKWADNGRVFTRDELDRYMKEYRRRSGAKDWMYSRGFRQLQRELAGSRWGAAVASLELPIVNTIRRWLDSL